MANNHIFKKIVVENKPVVENKISKSIEDFKVKKQWLKDNPLRCPDCGNVLEIVFDSSQRGYHLICIKYTK